MAIKHSITLSTTEPNNEVGVIKIRQADEQTQTLQVQITENGVPKSYQGLAVYFCAKLGQTAGLGIIEQKLKPEEMTNPANGKLEYTMRAEDWQILGRQKGYFSFRKMKDEHEFVEQFTTRDFTFDVIKSVYSDGLKEVKKDGSTYVWTIEDLIRLFNEYMASGKTDWEEFVEQNRETLESVDPGGKLIGELIDARKPFGSDAYATLGERLDESDAQLAQIDTKQNARNYVDLLGTIKYGKIDIEAITNELGFPTFNHNMTFNLYRDIDGKVKHTFDFDKRIEGWSVFYIDGVNGVQSNDGLTESTPKLDTALTIQEIEADSGISSAVIVWLGDYIPRTRSAIGTSVSITKNYAIVTQKEEFYAGSIEPELSWTSEANNVYSATRSGVTCVFDSTIKDLYDLPTKYIEVSTLAECEQTNGSWYQSGSTVYVHRLNNAIPTNGETYICVDAYTLQPIFQADKLVMMRDVTLLSGSTQQPAFFSSDESTKGNVILDGVKVHSSSGDTNGISCDNLKSIWLFNCLGIDINRDVFNYHATNGGHCFVFEYDCFGENAGIDDFNEINNITSAHEAIHILRVNSKGRNSRGPVLADVHGCYSISIDCNMNESLIADDNAYNKAAFFFEDSTGTDGHAILINCSGGDSRTKGISCGTTFKAEGKIAIMNFVGRNVPNDINFDIG